MTMAYDLYGGKPPHQKTGTSEAAADAIEPHVGRLQAIVIDHIRRCASDGNIGSTDKETEEATGIIHENVSARRRELVQKGLVVDSGMSRRTPSNRSATVWAPAPPGTTATVEPGTATKASPPVAPIPDVIERALEDLSAMKMLALTKLHYRIKHPAETNAVMQWLRFKAGEDVDVNEKDKPDA